MNGCHLKSAIHATSKGHRIARLREQAAPKTPEGGQITSIFTILFVILLLAVLGWGVLHVTGALIHILLVVALISLVLHFVRGGPRTV